MSQESIPALPSPLESVRYKFEEWRKSRKSLREPIPDNLWTTAADFCKQYSINQVSRALHLNYMALKKKVSGQSLVTDKKKASSPLLVELDCQRSFPASECVIEMENVYGSKMRMSFKGRADLDLLELGKAFWSKGK
jgi:hypothetical protein